MGERGSTASWTSTSGWCIRGAIPSWRNSRNQTGSLVNKLRFVLSCHTPLAYPSSRNDRMSMDFCQQLRFVHFRDDTIDSDFKKPNKGGQFKYLNVSGEYAKIILPYMENTPIDIKLRLSRRISAQNQKKFWSKITSPNMIEWPKKPSHATVPLRIEVTFWGCHKNTNHQNIEERMFFH